MFGLGSLAVVACAGAAIVLYAHRIKTPDGTAEPGGEAALMDEAQREYLWDIEHHGLVLTKKGFSLLADALSKQDRRALTAVLAPDFKGELLDQSGGVRASTPYAEVVRQEPGARAGATVTREQFVDQLLRYRALFAKPPKVQFALMTLSPVTRGDVKGTWEGKGQLRLAGDMGKGNPGEVMLYLKYRTRQPTPRVLRAGSWLRYGAIEQAQTARSRQGFLMEEVADKWGVDVSRFHDNWLLKKGTEPHVNTGGVYLCDYDRDGILDMLVTDPNGIALYRGEINKGQFHFVEVTEEVGLPRTWINGYGPAVNAFVDIDGDGWDDLILGGTIYRNMRDDKVPGGRRFRDYSSLSNLRLPPDATGLVVADYDRDGRLDLYVTRPGRGKADSWLSGSSGDPTRGNQLWRNLGHWRFDNVTATSGAGGGSRSTFSAVWLDADNDGWPDLYVINEFGNGVLLMNQQDGTFKEHQLAQGPADFGSMGVAAGDIDNDGNIDLYIGNMYSKAGNRVIGNMKDGTYPGPVTAKIRSFVAGSQLWRNRGGLTFDRQGKQLQVNGCGWAYGPALVDLDNDGFLDIYATCGFISQSRTEPDG
jgi:hypothetical protein